jgi:hypothetical protein
VVHPLQTQAVTYVVQRFASLATFFYLFSLIMYIKARLTQTAEAQVEVKVEKRKVLGIVYYIFSIISAVLAMKTKEIALTLPLIITLYEFLFFKDGLRKRV